MNICPNLNNKQVREEFEELKSMFGEDAAYYFWDKTGGEGLLNDTFNQFMKTSGNREFSLTASAIEIAHKNREGFMVAPNGQPTNLSKQQWIQVRTNQFEEWFGDWQSINSFNVDNIDTSKVDIEYHEKPWKETEDGRHLNPDGSVKSNEIIRLYIKGQKEKGYFELVKDKEFGQFSVHFKTTKPGAQFNSKTAVASNKEDRKTLFIELIKAIPEGAIVSTWGSLSDEGIHGLNNVGRNMVKISERDAVSKVDGKPIKLPIFRNSKNDILKNLDENGEPIITEELQANFLRFLNKATHSLPVVILDGKPSIDTQKCNISNLLGDYIFGRITTEAVVTSDEVVNRLLDQNVFDIHNITLAQVLSSHKIRVVVDNNLGMTKLASTITDEHGNSVIVINPKALNTVSNSYAAITILHEISHSLTHNALNNPKTREERQFKKNTTSAFKTFKKIYNKYTQAFQTLWYTFSNENEFVSTFLTDRSIRESLKNLAIIEDRKNKGTLKQIFKDFVNSLSNILLNKKLFLNNVDRYNKLQKELFEYIYNKPKTSTNLSSQLNNIIDLYRNSNGGALNTECVLDLFNKMNKRQKYFTSDNVDVSRQAIADMLGIRIKALGASSDSQILDRQRLLLDAKNYEAMFRNSDNKTSTVLSAFLKSTSSQLHQDFKQLQELYNNDKVLTSEQYIYHKHSNFEMYNRIISSIEAIFLEKDNGLTVEEIQELKNQNNALSVTCKNGTSILDMMLNKICGQTLQEVKQDTLAPDLDKAIQNLTDGQEVIADDISWLWKNVGINDSSTHPILKSLFHILNTATAVAEEEALSSIVPLIKLANGLDVGKLYEKQNGRYTGYLIRKYNYGKFNEEYSQFLKNLNKDISEKYNIVIEEDNTNAPQENEQARIEWHLRRNEWLDKHAERKHTKEYYDAYAKLPDFARASLNAIDREIYALLNKPQYVVSETDEKGKQYQRVQYEKITKEDWESYLRLRSQKKSLSSFYDIYGNKKLEGTIEYKVAKALQDLHNELYADKQIDIKKRTKQWEATRNRIIEQCGGMDKFKEYTADKDAYIKNHRNDKDAFDYKTFEFWEERNSIYVFKNNPTTGIGLVFEKINEELEGIQIDYGPQYDQNKKEIAEILKPFKDQNQEVILELLPEKIKRRIYELQQEQYKIVKKASKNNRIIAQLQKKRSKIYQKYLTSEDTKYYKKVKAKIDQSLHNDDFYSDDINEFFYALSPYGRLRLDYLSGDVTGIDPYLWTQKQMAIDVDMYMEILPGDAWLDSDNSVYLNKNFSEEEKESIIPKANLYRNEEYDKLMSDQRYKKLYDAVVDYMHRANAKQTNRRYTNDYLLPQIQGTVLQRMHHEPSILSKALKFFKWFAQKLGFGRDENDDANVGNTYIEQSDGEGGGYLKKHKNVEGGKYPDGTPFYILPQPYTSKLKDPSTISSDLIHILYTYYLMSASYEQKSKIRGKMETLLDKLRGRVNISESNAYASAKSFLERNLYDMKRARIKGFTTKEGENIFDAGRALETWKQYATARNLGMNPKVAIVGGLTAQFVHITKQIAWSIPGVHGLYNIKDGMRAFKETIYKLFTKGYDYITNPQSDDVLMGIMEYCNLVGQAERKTKYLNRDTVARIISNNYVYAPLTITDFVAKSNFALSIIMSHRYVDGQFLTKSDLYYHRRKYGEEKFKQLLHEFNKAPSLYSLLKMKNGLLTVQDEYKEAWDKSKIMIRNRIQKLSASYDGTVTGLQQCMLTQNIIGALVLMHRQFVTLSLQENFGEATYDYDTKTYKNGQFRDFFILISKLAKENIFFGAAASSLLGLGFMGPYGLVLLPAGMAIYGIVKKIRNRYSNDQNRNTEEKIGVKNTIKNFFNDESSEEAYMKSLHRRSNVAITLTEIILLNFIIEPIITSMCKTYDDDDRWWIQNLLYWLRCFAWEAGTKYKTTELLNNIRSATAATSVTDSFIEVSQALQSRLGGSKYFNPMYDIGRLMGIIKNPYEDEEHEEIVQSGPYKGYSKTQKSIFKTLPMHNLYEQFKDAKTKRKYQETQIQKLPESQR